MKLDIVTVTYNSEKYLRRCLQSVKINRSVINKFIVIDGKSDDKTIGIISEFSEIVSVFISEKDSGISEAFNKGITYCSGDFVLLLNSDDYIIDLNLISFVDKLSIRDKIVCTRMLSYSTNGFQGSFNSKPDLIPVYNSMLHPGCVIALDVYRQLGLYDLALKTSMDYDFFCRCFKAGIVFTVIETPLVAFQEGGFSRIKEYRALYESYILRRKYHAALFPVHEVKQLVCRVIGRLLGVFGIKEIVKKLIRRP